MAGMQWIRHDTNMLRNPKFLQLKAEGKWKQIVIHFEAMEYVGGQGLDGFIPDYVLPVVGATKKDAYLLVDYGIWDMEAAGFSIHDWTDFQPSDEDTQRRRQRAKKGGCVKNHGPECGCWRNA